MNNELKIRTLIDRFFDGQTSLGEEQMLYDFFGQAGQLPADLEHLRPMFADLLAVRHVATALQPTATPPVPATRPAPASRRRLWGAAAVVVVLLLGGTALLFRHHAQPLANEAEDELVGYVYGRRVTDRGQVLSEVQRTMTAMTMPDGPDEVEEQLKAMFDN